MFVASLALSAPSLVYARMRIWGYLLFERPMGGDDRDFGAFWREERKEVKMFNTSAAV